MPDLALAAEIQTDLRSIITEALQRKAILHVKDRAEKAVSSLSLVSDDESWDRAVDDVLSSLLIATEVGTVPKLILHSLTILQRLSATHVSGTTFLHMITVLCKATWSVSLSVMNPISVEIELAQIKCLQTVTLFQTDILSVYFLDTVSLSQIVSVCTNLINHPYSTPTVVQTACATIRQLGHFVSQLKPVPDPAVFDPLVNGQNQVIGFSQVSSSPVFLFTHDLITMGFPKDTSLVVCPIFGSSRIDASLALDMLSDFFYSPLISIYLIPLLLRSFDLSLSSSWSLQLGLVVKLHSHKNIIPVLFYLSNLLSDFFSTHQVVTETLREIVLVDPQILIATEIDFPGSTPFGGDSPGRVNYNLGEILICRICQFIHQPDAPASGEVDKSVALMITAVEALVTLSEKSSILSTVSSVWPSVLSCLSLLADKRHVKTFQHLLLLCALLPDAVEGIINTLLKLHPTISVSEILSECKTVELPLHLWRRIFRSLEATGSTEVELFESVKDVPLATRALLSESVSDWQIKRIGFLFSNSNLSLFESSKLWSEAVQPLIKTELSALLISSFLALVETVVTANKAPEEAIQSLVLLAPAAPTLTGECLLTLVTTSGHLWTLSTWEACLNVMEQGLGTTGKIAELIVDDFLNTNLIPIIPRLIKIFTSLFSEASLNTCFKSIASVLKCIEQMSVSDESSNDLAAKEFFLSACIDARSGARNCAVKTLAGVPQLAICEILLPVFQPLRGPPYPDETSGLLMHHSRDTEEKRWSETRVLAIQSCETCLNKRGIDGIISAGWASNSGEVLLATFRLLKFDLQFCDSEILPMEIQKIEDSNIFPLSSKLFLPYWILNSFELQNGYLYYSSVLSHKSHYEESVSYMIKSPNHEVEAYKCICEKTNLHFPYYEPISVKLSEFLENIINFDFMIRHFSNEEITLLLLNPESMFRDSFTIELALRCLSQVECLSEILKKIAASRYGSLGIASSGVWVFGYQQLISRRSHDELFECLHSQRWDERGVDILDYHAVSIVLKSVDCTEWKNSEIEKLNDVSAKFETCDHLRKFILFVSIQQNLVWVDSKKEINEEFFFGNIVNEKEEWMHFDYIRGEDSFDVLMKIVRKIFKSNYTPSVLALLEIFYSTKSEKFISAAWDEICTVLIPYGSDSVRQLLGSVLMGFSNI